MTIYEQAHFSQRLRTRDVPEWCEFLRLWAAFNCIYSGQTGDTERERVMQSIKADLSDSAAQEVIDRIASVAEAIIEIPPGDMRKDASDPQFRAQTERCTSLYIDQTKLSRERLAGLIGVIYQVRCNLLHGGKDPDDYRDLSLVSSSNSILQIFLPVLERAITAAPNTSVKPNPLGSAA